MRRLHIEPLGDSALLLRVARRIDAAAELRVRAACERLERARIEGVSDVAPAFTTVAVHYDPARIAFDTLAARVREVLRGCTAADASAGRLVEVPVRYGGADGPDLEVVAAHTGLSPAEVVRLHAAGEYRVHMIGFAPGFPYLGGLDPRLACPRRDAPRTEVPAGSVGIGGAQTGIYPVVSPGGWQLIGRTSLALFDPASARPSLLAAGDRVRFVEVRA